jgi:hypothetical protein
LDLAILVNNITLAATSIDFGRKGFATRGKAEEGQFYLKMVSHEPCQYFVMP